MNIATPLSCYPVALPTVDEALAIVSSCLRPCREIEQVSLAQAAGRVLARDAMATFAMPPWDRSAMDGFAFRGDGGGPFRMVGNASAGSAFCGTVAAGECIKVSTGARLPAGCDTVAMREHCLERKGTVRLAAEVRRGAHVRQRGEDFSPRDTLAASGVRLDARHIALLASAGLREVAVTRRLRLGIVSIGDEFHPAPGQQLFDVNRAMLAALCRDADVTDLGILRDRRGSIAAVLAAAATCHDAIVSSGGTSEGDEDHVRSALRDCGGDLLVAGVAIKPGKPVTFGRIGDCLHIALPGNPVAALVTFLALGAPLIGHLAGEPARRVRMHPVRAAFAHAKKRGLREYLRVTLRDGAYGLPWAEAGGRNGSAMLLSLAQSDGLVCLDESVTDVTPGAILACHTFAELLA